MGKININLTYPRNDMFEYVTRLERINLDESRKYDIENDRGFIINSPQQIKKELKNPNGIFSTKFGTTMQDANAFADRYKCDCGLTTSRIENDMICKHCGTPVKYVDEDFTYFGWMVLNKYYVIHPGMYKSIEFLIGDQKLVRILQLEDIKDEDGHSMEREVTKDEPFKGIGMIQFKERFDEIIQYYRVKSGKEEQYFDIMRNRDLIFTHSIPVYTTHLRPYNIDGENFVFEGTNAAYNMMSRLTYCINKDNVSIYRQTKSKNDLLFDLQMKWGELYKEIENIISGKTGIIRRLFGGRYNFTSRDVIVGTNDYKIDEIGLPYTCLVELFQMRIINILEKTYHRGYDDAYQKWQKASMRFDQTIYNIINDIIHDPNEYGGRGPQAIINRNPTISYGSILSMHIVEITKNFTMVIPLRILELLAADFDGDVLNLLWIINKSFARLADDIYNPRMMNIDHNDGKFNNMVNHSKDTIINATTFIRLGKSAYTAEDLRKIEMIRR